MRKVAQRKAPVLCEKRVHATDTVRLSVQSACSAVDLLGGAHGVRLEPFTQHRASPPARHGKRKLKILPDRADKGASRQVRTAVRWLREATIGKTKMLTGRGVLEGVHLLSTTGDWTLLSPECPQVPLQELRQQFHCELILSASRGAQVTVADGQEGREQHRSVPRVPKVSVHRRKTRRSACRKAAVP